MYKVNIPDDPKSSYNTITNCVINTDFDYVDSDGATQTVKSSWQYQPVYASPTVTVNNTVSSSGAIQYNVSIFFGTGDSPYADEDINTGTTQYHFYAYKDTDGKGICGSNVSLSWYYELPAGERIWASAFSAAGDIYFGTSTAETEDPCDATTTATNSGKLYVFSTSGTEKAAFNTGNITTSPVVEDEHIYFKTSDGLSSIGGSTYNNRKAMTGTGSSQILSWEEINN